MAEINYEKALTELNTILEDIDNQDIKVDDLVKKVKRGAELIKQCKTKLTEIESEVNNVLDGLEKSFQKEKKQN